jgi:hypothetical protein
MGVSLRLVGVPRNPQLGKPQKTGEIAADTPYFRIFRFDPASAEQYN